jgi:hypothetical protein
MGDPHERVVFEVEGHPYRWSDVVAAARISGEWTRIAEQAGAGLARLRAAGAARAGPSEDAVNAAAQEFRYARRLLSADEMADWLAHWGITAGEWLDDLRATLLLSRDKSAIAPAAATGQAEWVHAVCSGDARRLARRLAAQAAVAAVGRPGPPRPPLDATAIDALERTFARFRDAVCADGGLIDREVAAQRQAWTRLRWRGVAHPLEEAAREAALCLREDGLTLEQVAGRAGLAVEESSALFEDTDPRLAAALLGARADAVLGPLRIGDEHWLLVAGQAEPPAVTDGSVRARATARILERAVGREVATRVVWRERD